MKLNKILAGIVSVAFLSGLAVSPVAASQPIAIPIKEPMPIEKQQAKYVAITGTVNNIEAYHADKTAQFVSIEGEIGPANIILAADTYVVDNAEIAVGTEIICFHDASKPMIMIYPPQIKADLVAVKSDNRNIKVDTFNQDLVSQDNSLKLNISEDTEVSLPDGTPYTGELANHKLVVIYGASTKSIPAQTNPKKVVVLDEVAQGNGDFYDENYQPIVANMNIVVNNDIVISSPKAYTNDTGVVMIPLRVIAEALGYEVGWDSETYSVTVGKNVAFKIDSNDYTIADNSAISLDTAPALVNDTTYVPLNFFTQVLLMNNAYVFEGQIDINDGEKME